MSEVQFKSKIHNYTVFFKNDFSFMKKLINIENKVFVIDKNVYALYAEFFEKIDDEDILLLEAKEECKTLESVKMVYDFLANKDSKRNTTLISIGGGIIQDITGFAASTLYRGLRWIFVPTTFLAQTDSCIGSKTSLNYKSFKNILGGFYPPNEIYIQPQFLNTLSEKDYFSGIGEVVKFHLLEEKWPLNYKHVEGVVTQLHNKENVLAIIKATLEIKKSYIDIDEFDNGKRNLFNYGHCYGHALENSSLYEVPHGIAVTIGMVYANIVAKNRHYISNDLFNYLNQKIFLKNIPIKLDRGHFNREVLIESMKNDKKRIGKDLTMIVPSSDDIMAKKIDDLTEQEFIVAQDELLKVLGL